MGSASRTPPACTLNYAGLKVECAMTDLNIKRSPFKDDGDPLRAELPSARSRSSRSRSTRWSGRLRRLIDVGKSYDRKGSVDRPQGQHADRGGVRGDAPSVPTSRSTGCLFLVVLFEPGRRRARCIRPSRRARCRRPPTSRRRRRTSTRSSPARRSSCWLFRYFGSSAAWWLIADANPTAFPARPRRRARCSPSRPTASPGRVERTRSF